jgi:hypothetical protein
MPVAGRRSNNDGTRLASGLLSRYEFRSLLIKSHTARNINGVYTHPEGN